MEMSWEKLKTQLNDPVLAKLAQEADKKLRELLPLLMVSRIESVIRIGIFIQSLEKQLYEVEKIKNLSGIELKDSYFLASKHFNEFLELSRKILTYSQSSSEPSVPSEVVEKKTSSEDRGKVVRLIEDEIKKRAIGASGD